MDYVGAVRVTSIAGKLMFEKLSELDSHGMHMCVAARVTPAAYCSNVKLTCVLAALHSMLLVLACA